MDALLPLMWLAIFLAAASVFGAVQWIGWRFWRDKGWVAKAIVIPIALVIGGYAAMATFVLLPFAIAIGTAGPNAKF